MRAKETTEYSENNDAIVTQDENSCAKIDMPNSVENNYDIPDSDIDLEENVALSGSVVKHKKAFKLTGVVAMVVAAVAALGIVTNKTPKISLADSVIGDNYYAYILQVENADGAPLKLKIYNDYYKVETKIDSGNIKGILQDLAPNTGYKIEVKGSQGFGEKTFFSSKFTTLKSAADFKTSVTATYKKDKDFIYYTLLIDDFLQYYTNYQAFIKVDDVTTKLQIIGKITDEQSIPIKGITAKEIIFFVTADSSMPSDVDSNNNNKVVYSAKIKT